MSDFCDFVPDDPSCQIDEPVVDDGSKAGGDMGGDMDGMDGEMHMEGDPMMGNLTYLHVALFGMIHGGLELFRYHDAEHFDSWDDMAADSTNLWEYFSHPFHYLHFGFSTILTITQALSMAGIAGEVNIMAWMYIEMAEVVLGLIQKLSLMYAYDTAFTVSQDADSTADELTGAAAVMEGIQSESVEALVASTATHFALHTEHSNWMMAQVMALPEEVQGKYKHDEHGDKEEHHDENMEKMQEFGYFVI